LGNKLKTAREEKGLSLVQISNETNISSRYLDALEKEDYTPFPGEPYVQGFIKSYGEYLGLNPNELLSLYRSIRMQEQPIPVEQLLKGPSRAPKIIGVIAAIIGGIAIIAGAVYFISGLPAATPPPQPAVRAAVEYRLSTDFFERRLYPGDSILVSDGSSAYKLVFTSLSDVVTISTPGGPVMLDLGQEVLIDLNGDLMSEFRITAEDFVKNEVSSGALLRFEQIAKPQVEPQPVAFSLGSIETLPGEGEQVTVIFPAAGVSPPASAFPFTLQASFQGFCLFRYEILFERDRPDRVEQYYQRSEEISVSAQNGIRLGISNAHAVKLQVIVAGRTYPFDTGGAGEVVAADLRWVRDSDNRFRLVLIRLD